MKNHQIPNKIFFLAFVLLFSVFAPVYAEPEPLADGIYSAVFSTDSSMFKVNETKDGRGVLTVKEGEMTIHVALTSKNIVNLFPGLAEDAKKEDAVLLEPMTESITYSDGFQDEVYSFDIPVPFLDEEFDTALVGKKGKWYDHKVSVSDPVFEGPLEETAVEDGEFFCDITLKGGSGRASVESPALVTVKEGKATAVIVWSSPNYEYMLVDGERYEPLNKSGNSSFEIPVILNSEMAVSASTAAMSQPHLIDYTLLFSKK